MIVCLFENWYEHRNNLLHSGIKEGYIYTRTIYIYTYICSHEIDNEMEKTYNT